jgi:hypothetical protein
MQPALTPALSLALLLPRLRPWPAAQGLDGAWEGARLRLPAAPPPPQKMNPSPRCGTRRWPSLAGDRPAGLFGAASLLPRLSPLPPAPPTCISPAQDYGELLREAGFDAVAAMDRTEQVGPKLVLCFSAICNQPPWPTCVFFLPKQ